MCVGVCAARAAAGGTPVALTLQGPRGPEAPRSPAVPRPASRSALAPLPPPVRGLLPSARAALQSPRPSPPDRLVERPSAAFPCDRGVPGRRTAGPRGGRTRCRPRVPLNPRTWATALAGFLAAALTKKRAMATEQRQLRSTLPGAPSVSASPPESDMRLLVTLWATAGPPRPSRVSAEPPRCPPPRGSCGAEGPPPALPLWCPRGPHVAGEAPCALPAFQHPHALGSSRLWSHRYLRLIWIFFFLPRSPHQSFLQGVLENMTQCARCCRGVSADTDACLGYPAPAHAGLAPAQPVPGGHRSVTARSPRPPPPSFHVFSPRPALSERALPRRTG